MPIPLHEHTGSLLVAKRNLSPIIFHFPYDHSILKLSPLLLLVEVHHKRTTCVAAVPGLDTNLRCRRRLCGVAEPIYICIFRIGVSSILEHLKSGLNVVRLDSRLNVVRASSESHATKLREQMRKFVVCNLLTRSDSCSNFCRSWQKKDTVPMMPCSHGAVVEPGKAEDGLQVRSSRPVAKPCLDKFVRCQRGDQFHCSSKQRTDTTSGDASLEADVLDRSPNNDRAVRSRDEIDRLSKEHGSKSVCAFTAAFKRSKLQHLSFDRFHGQGDQFSGPSACGENVVISLDSRAVFQSQAFDSASPSNERQVRDSCVYEIHIAVFSCRSQCFEQSTVVD
mmetsp:Transcript_8888/g.26697  ORF Transcript_8888/g.26697 Transcript_8888/m.26697 type:complete len:336 (-) Transcript_8888:597-1604(-)